MAHSLDGLVIWCVGARGAQSRWRDRQVASQEDGEVKSCPIIITWEWHTEGTHCGVLDVFDARWRQRLGPLRPWWGQRGSTPLGPPCRPGCP